MGDWGQTKQTFSVNIFLGPRFHSGGPGISTGCFFSHWYPPKKFKYGKPRLGESTLT